MILETLLLIPLLIYLLYLYKTREVIIDGDGSPYLIRYFLWKPKRGTKIYIHHIVRSDHDRAEHCHPFNFTSLILWGGYYEVAEENQEEMFCLYEGTNPRGWHFGLKSGWKHFNEKEAIKWFGMFSVLRRKAAWRHRLLLPEGKTALTLVIRSSKIRDWGFYPDGKFCHNEKYDTKTGLCGED